MNKTVKTILLLCGIVAASVSLNASANAQTFPPASMQGSGSESSPWQITSAEDLHALALFVNNNSGNANSTEGKHYRIMNDIDLTEFLEGNSKGWLPIGRCEDILGNTRCAFKGYMHGGGHIISGLRINRSDAEQNYAENFYIGLFGVIENAHIDSIGVEVAVGDSVKGDNYTGILVGYSYWNSKIEQSYTKGKVAGQLHVGGMAGWFAGGSIEHSYADAQVFGSSKYVGGLVGHLYYGGEVKHCYTVDDIEGYTRVGGLIGNVHHDSASVLYCVVAETKITGTGSKIIGNNNADHLKFDYNYTGTRVVHDGENSGYNGTEVDYETLRTDEFYTNPDNWGGDIPDFYDIWAIDSGELPLLSWQVLPKPVEPIAPTITTTSLPSDTVHKEYLAVLTAEGDSIITWTLDRGALPEGLSLSADGVISGVPALAGQYVFTVKASNDAGSDTAELFITIIPVLGVGVDNNLRGVSLQAYIQNNILYVKGLTVGEPWYVYSISGILIHKGIAKTDMETLRINSITRGVYIIQSENKSVKVLY